MDTSVIGKSIVTILLIGFLVFGINLPRARCGSGLGWGGATKSVFKSDLLSA